MTREIQLYTDSDSIIKFIHKTNTASRDAKPNGEIFVLIRNVIYTIPEVKFNIQIFFNQLNHTSTFSENPPKYLLSKWKMTACTIRKDTNSTNLTILLPEIEYGTITLQNSRDKISKNIIIKTID